MKREESQSQSNVNIFIFDGEKYYVSYLFNKYCLNWISIWMLAFAAEAVQKLFRVSFGT